MSHPNSRLSHAPHPCPIHGGTSGTNPVAGAPIMGVAASRGGAQHPHPALPRTCSCSPGQPSLASQADVPNGARCPRTDHNGLKLKCSKLISHEGNQQTTKRCQAWHPPVEPLGLVPDVQDCHDPSIQMVLAVSEAQGTLSPCHLWSSVSGEGPLGGPGHLN